MLVPAAVAFALMVKVMSSLIAVITVPAGIPVPLTAAPTLSVEVSATVTIRRLDPVFSVVPARETGAAVAFVMVVVPVGSAFGAVTWIKPRAAVRSPVNVPEEPPKTSVPFPVFVSPLPETPPRRLNTAELVFTVTLEPTVVVPVTPIQPVPSWLFTVSTALLPRFRLAMELFTSAPRPSRVTLAAAGTMKVLLIWAALL